MSKIKNKDLIFEWHLSNMSYPENIQDNERFRLWIIEECENDPEVANLVKNICANDILFYANVFAWTANPRIEPFDFCFVTYAFQDRFLKEIVECIETGQDSITEKSRDMGFSWLLTIVHSWAFFFKGWSSLYGSYKENYVDMQGNMDSFFERLRYVIDRLPGFLLPEDMEMKFMLISSKSLGAEIAGDSGKNFGTGGRRKFVSLDEFSYWQFDETAFRKTRDVTNCRIFGGTPDGKNNVYGKIMTNHSDYAHLDIHKIRLHWSEHPHKTREWYEKEKLKRTPEDVARELDISYDASVRGAVYKDFANRVNIGEFPYDPNLKIYTSWDFGRDMVAIIWWQYDPKTKRIKIIGSYQKSAYESGVDLEIDFFAAFVNGIPTQGYVYSEKELAIINYHKAWAYNYEQHFGDPYNANSKQINSKNSIADKLREFGIHIVAERKSSVAERIKAVQLKLRDIDIDIRNQTLISAMEQSRYPETRATSQATKEKTLPIHDENSHYRTAFEYFIDMFSPPLEGSQQSFHAEPIDDPFYKPEGYGTSFGLDDPF